MNLGKILGISKNQHIILRGSDWQSIKNPPKIGEKVYTVEKLKIGYIFDIFGPVSKPFLSVKLYSKGSTRLEPSQVKQGSFLYTYQDDPLEKRKNFSSKRKISVLTHQQRKTPKKEHLKAFIGFHYHLNPKKGQIKLYLKHDPNK